MPSFRGPVFVVALATVAFIALSAGQALANHVQCGDVITQDTRLDSDLINCPGDGIVIGADDITLDLNNHVIEGPGIAVSSTGVDDTRGHDGVTIEDGAIHNFETGIQLASASRNVLRGLSSSQNAFGIFASFFSNENLIEKNSISDNANLGIATSDSIGNLVRRNTVSDNAIVGINIGGGSFNDVEKNSVSGSETGIAVGDTADNAVMRNSVFDNGVGIQATDSPYRTHVEKNFAYANAKDGILVDCCQDVVLGNVANTNGDDGIDTGFGGDDGFRPNAASGNTANFNGDLGIEAVPGVTDGGGNRAFGNGNPLQCLNISCKTEGKRKK